MTELETFKSWMNREGVEFTEAPSELTDNGTDLDVQGSHAIATVTFREDGSFDYLTACE